MEERSMMYAADRASILRHFRHQRDWARKKYRMMTSARYQKELESVVWARTVFLSVVASLVIGAIAMLMGLLFPEAPTGDIVAIFIMSEFAAFFLVYHKVDGVTNAGYQRELTYVLETLERSEQSLSELS